MELINLEDISDVENFLANIAWKVLNLPYLVTVNQITTMSKKHFERFATIISHEIYTGENILNKGLECGNAWRDCAKNIALNMADFFANENPRFNKGKFLEACGIK